jgi:hypothetical protein
MSNNEFIIEYYENKSAFFTADVSNVFWMYK